MVLLKNIVGKVDVKIFSALTLLCMGLSCNSSSVGMPLVLINHSNMQAEAIQTWMSAEIHSLMFWLIQYKFDDYSIIRLIFSHREHCPIKIKKKILKINLKKKMKGCRAGNFISTLGRVCFFLLFPAFFSFFQFSFFQNLLVFSFFLMPK